MVKVNLHTHTARCGHASGTDEAFVLAAIDGGFTRLGFADHTPFPYEDGYVNSSKMRPEELEGYVQSVLSLKKKYCGQIEILLGLECESVPRYFPYLKEISRDMDYLLLGNHGDWSVGQPYMATLTEPHQLEMYVQTAVEGMESGLFLYLAHPDLMLCSYEMFDDTAKNLSRQLCREANRLHIPVEYNFHGSLKKVVPPALGYPCDAFWEIAAEENVRAVVGVDAHKPAEFEMCDLPAMIQKLEDMGITVLRDPMKA